MEQQDTSVVTNALEADPVEAVELDTAAAALRSWAKDVPIIASVRVLDVAARFLDATEPGDRSIESEVELSVLKTLRGSLAADLPTNEPLRMRLPGGEVNGMAMITSRAPVFHGGDEGLLALAIVEGAPRPAKGSGSFLRTTNGTLVFHTTPSIEGAKQASESGYLLLTPTTGASQGVEDTPHELTPAELAALLGS